MTMNGGMQIYFKKTKLSIDIQASIFFLNRRKEKGSLGIVNQKYFNLLNFTYFLSLSWFPKTQLGRPNGSFFPPSRLVLQFTGHHLSFTLSCVPDYRSQLIDLQLANAVMRIIALNSFPNVLKD